MGFIRNMWESSRSRAAFIGLIMVLAVFLANGFVTYANLRRIGRNAELVERSHQVLGEVKTLRIRVVDAETGMRGFVITGDPSFLQPYEAALASLDETRGRLRDLIRDAPGHRQPFEQLERHVDASLLFVQSVVKLRQDGQLEEASRAIRGGHGRQLMDAVRTTLRTIEQEEYRLLSARDRETGTAYVTAMTTGLLTSAFGIGLTAVAYAMILRESNKREQAVIALEQANAFLEHRVTERTMELSQSNSLMRSEIDERRRAEDQVRLFAEELQRSNRELEQFASVASHDLQEPLRKIQAFGDRLTERFRNELGPQGQDYIDRMLASAKRMRKLIDDLLDYSRVTTKAQPFASVDLSEIVHDVAADLEARLLQSGGRLEIGELPVVRASPLQMRQLFQNLISNALKFHRPDAPPVVRVDSRTVPAADSGDGTGLQCEIVVEDNGIGFEPEYGERIFDLFQRLHGKDEYEGTGIGLAICRKIVERHNGQITAEGTPGEGSRFLVTLPAEPTG